VVSLLWALLGILAGACIAIQGPINAQLARGLGFPVAAAALSFLSGAILLVAITTIGALASGASLNWRAPPPWTFAAGGFLGTVYVTAAVFLVPRLGAAAVMALAVAGQLLAGLVLDRIGFMGMAVRELSLGRVAGAVLLVVAVVMIRML
jgi:bacterial/archaeal transporter family-2 protein